MNARPPRSSLFPNTTLFRSLPRREREELRAVRPVHPDQAIATIRHPHLGVLAVIRHAARPHERAVVEVLIEHQYGAVLEARSEEHTSELQLQSNIVCRLLLE